MVADTTSPLLQLLLQGTGNNNNAWGGNLNNQVILPIEQAIAGITTIAVTGASNVNLTDDQSRSSTIVLTGELTANQTIIVPSRAKSWKFLNNCTGDFYVLVKTSAGSARNAPYGKFTRMICDGTSVYREDQELVGNYFFHGGSSPPAGSIECKGGNGLRAGLVDLYGAIGTTHGDGDGFTTFGLPNAYDTARFLRARSATLTAGTKQASKNKSHTHTGSGTTSTEGSAHTHTGSGTTGSETAEHQHAGSGTTSSESAVHSHYISGSSGTESHNHNHSLTACVGSSTSPGGNFSTGGPPATFNTSLESQTHYHSIAMNSGTQSANHTHTYSFTTGSENTYHQHSYSFTTASQSTNHTHTYSFTTSTGSEDDTESRPESLVGILCIWY